MSRILWKNKYQLDRAGAKIHCTNYSVTLLIIKFFIFMAKISLDGRFIFCVTFVNSRHGGNYSLHFTADNREVAGHHSPILLQHNYKKVGY
jgi:hypothetical protein